MRFVAIRLIEARLQELLLETVIYIFKKSLIMNSSGVLVKAFIYHMPTGVAIVKGFQYFPYDLSPLSKGRLIKNTVIHINIPHYLSR